MLFRDGKNSLISRGRIRSERRVPAENVDETQPVTHKKRHHPHGQTGQGKEGGSSSAKK